MGEEIEPYEPGENCPACWGEGKTFGNYPTPKRIYITGSGFVGDCAICNGKFLAEQDAVDHCKWAFDNGTVAGHWICGDVATDFMLRISGGDQCYFKREGLCAKTSSIFDRTVEVS